MPQVMGLPPPFGCQKVEARLSKLYVKSSAASFVARMVVPNWAQMGLGGVSWTQEAVPVKGAPAIPDPLALSDPSFVGGVASVRVAGGAAGARYLLRTAPADGRRVPSWVREVRVQVASES